MLTKYAGEALLICLYLDRAGAATSPTLSEELGIPLSDIRSVLPALMNGQMITKCTTAPNAYTLASSKITAGQVIACIEPKKSNVLLSAEGRALAWFETRIKQVQNQLTRKTIRQLNFDLVDLELYIMKSDDITKS